MDRGSSGNDKTGVEELIHKAYECLKDGDADSAMGFLKDALKLDYEHEEVRYALKCLNWWCEKIKPPDALKNPSLKGGYILSQWESYFAFLERIGKTRGETGDSCQKAIKRFVFVVAMNHFLVLLADGSSQNDALLLFQAGRCCKGAGEKEKALNYLEQASRLKKDDSAILSELADVNALLGDERAAKVLFREAFFLDPQQVDLKSMESEMIHKLRDRVRELGYNGNEVAEWIPVWGCIWGVFSVRRELKPVELGRLKQSIFSLENEYRSDSGADREVSAFSKPRLLNQYFWLMDHYEHNRGADTVKFMEETMMKIKCVDTVIHDQYRDRGVL